LAEDEGYHKGLKPRQLQMIAIGGAIGTGLFLGAGGRLHNAGPGLFLSYAFCGIFVFLILRALGELVLHRPSSGSLASNPESVGYDTFAHTTVVSTRIRLVRNSFCSAALASSVSFKPATAAAPHRVVSFINVVGCGTDPSNRIRQNRRT
jgi:L-asparagine transporter-like permease